MATGKLDIERRAKNGDFIYVGAKAATPKKISPVRATAVQDIAQSGEAVYHKHPLFKEFLRSGPLTPIHHRYWSAKSGLVEAPVGIDLADGDISEASSVYKGGRVDTAMPAGKSGVQ
jgi:hypothetical protein